MAIKQRKKLLDDFKTRAQVRAEKKGKMLDDLKARAQVRVEKELTCKFCGMKCLGKQYLDDHYNTDHGWWDTWWNTEWDTPAVWTPERFPNEQSSNSSKK